VIQKAHDESSEAIQKEREETNFEHQKEINQFVKSDEILNTKQIEKDYQEDE